MSEQLFNEYTLNEMRDEGTDEVHKMKEAIDERDKERRIKAMHEFTKIPNPGEKRNPKKAHKNALTKLPGIKPSRMSAKLKARLSHDSDTFMEAIGQKLLSLAVYHYLPELRKRQNDNDSAGDKELQKVSDCSRKLLL